MPFLQEGKTLSIDMKEVDPIMIEKLIHYFYHFEYADDDDRGDQALSPSQGPTGGSLAINAAMYIIGDRYMIGTLKDLAVAKFSAALASGWNQQDFPEVIQTIYDNTPASDRGLRDCMAPILKAHGKELQKDAAFVEVVRTHGDFAVDLIDAWAKSISPAEKSVVHKVGGLQGKYCHRCGLKKPPGFTGGCNYCGSTLQDLHLVTME